MAQYMQDRRGDISFATKEVLRKASSPTGLDDQNLKRIARYVEGVPRCVLDLPWAPMPDFLDVFVDSDWSGESETRKSTRGGAACLGVELEHWCATQATIPLSSAEAENKAAVRGLIEGFYMTNVMRQQGVDLQLRIWSDSSAAIGHCQRLGNGKRVRHLENHDL